MSDKPRTGGGALSNVNGRAFFQNGALQVHQLHSRCQRSCGSTTLVAMRAAANPSDQQARSWPARMKWSL